MEEIDYVPMVSPYNKSYNPSAKWKKVIDFTIEYIGRYREYLDQHKILLTLRYLYYREIEEAGILPISKNAYEGYIKVMAKARKDFDNENWDIIRKYVSDDTRFDEKQNFFGWLKPTENKFIETIVKYLRWERRIYPFNTMVEVWFEDDGMFQMYKHIPDKYRL